MVYQRNILTAGSNLKLPTFRDPKNYCRTNFEEYKTSLRTQMEKPYVKDLDLKEKIDMIYRPNAKIGNGSTAAAIRYELETLEKVGDKFHYKKG